MAEALNRCAHCSSEKFEKCRIVFELAVEHEDTWAQVAKKLYDDDPEEMLDTASEHISEDRDITYRVMEGMSCELSRQQIDENVNLLKG
jgi:hypothetical protein